jgi:hypothetical protein
VIFQKFDFAEKAIDPFGRYGHPYISPILNKIGENGGSLAMTVQAAPDFTATLASALNASFSESDAMLG